MIFWGNKEWEVDGFRRLARVTGFIEEERRARGGANFVGIFLK